MGIGYIYEFYKLIKQIKKTGKKIVIQYLSVYRTDIYIIKFLNKYLNSLEISRKFAIKKFV